MERKDLPDVIRSQAVSVSISSCRDGMARVLAFDFLLLPARRALPALDLAPGLALLPPLRRALPAFLLALRAGLANRSRHVLTRSAWFPGRRSPFFATVYGRTGCIAVNRPGHDPKPTSRNPADPDRFAANVAREWQRGDIGGCGQSGRIAQPNREPRRDARDGTARCKGRQFRRVVREGTLSADHRVRRKAATTTTSDSLARRSTVRLAPALRNREVGTYCPQPVLRPDAAAPTRVAPGPCVSGEPVVLVSGNAIRVCTGD